MQEQFGNLIRKERMAKGISQEKLAELSNLHRNYISDLERGKRNVSLNNIMKLFNALDIEVKINGNTILNNLAPF